MSRAAQKFDCPYALWAVPVLSWMITHFSPGTDIKLTFLQVGEQRDQQTQPKDLTDLESNFVLICRLTCCLDLYV